jgi:hypothetical protein
LQVPIDTAGCDDSLFPEKFHLCSGRLDFTAATANPVSLFDKVTNTTSKDITQFVSVRMPGYQLDETLYQRQASTPQDVITRHAIAGHEVPTLDPIHGWHEAQALVPQPVKYALRTLLDVGFGPGLRPGIVIREFSERTPVRQCHGRRILDTHAPLDRRIDQRHAAKRHPRKAPDIGFIVAIDQGHRLPPLEAFMRGNEPRNTCANYYYVTVVIGHTIILCLFLVVHLSKIYGPSIVAFSGPSHNDLTPAETRFPVTPVTRVCPRG